MSDTFPANKDTKSSYYFISYSRQEVSFADSFTRELEERGHATWIDFRNLVPGSAWQEQLDAGIEHAAAILLIVSKASMASDPVKDEWSKALQQGKRVVLIVFEAVELDAPLVHLEWVDFRQGFATAMQQLEGMLAGPTQEMNALPPKEFRLPPQPKAFYRLTLVALIMPVLALGAALPAYWLAGQSFAEGLLFLAAYYLFTSVLVSPRIVPLLSQVKKRSYELQKIRPILQGWAILNTIPMCIATILAMDIQNGAMLVLFLGLVVTAVILPWALAHSLLGQDMYRWAGPQGVPIRRIIQLPKHLPSSQPGRVAIEYAPPDRAIAEEIKTQLKKSGHRHVQDPHEAETILVLLSTYNTTTRFDPQTKVLIPVLIQACDVDPRLSQTQWVDLRLGGKRTIAALARLINYPNRLLQTLGVLPLRREIYPPIVNVLIYLLTLALVFSVVGLVIQIAVLINTIYIPLAKAVLGSFGYPGGVTGVVLTIQRVLGILLTMLIYIPLNYLGLKLLSTRQRRYFLGYPRLGLLVVLLIAVFPVLPVLAWFSKDLRLWVPK